MKLIRYIAISALCSALFLGCAGDRQPIGIPALMPMPAQVTMGDGVLVVPDDIELRGELAGHDRALVAGWLAEGGLMVRDGAAVAVECAVGDELLPSDEAYVLNVTTTAISISARTMRGVFYAVQTLSQMRAECGAELPVVSIADTPRFAVRGLLVDLTDSRLGGREFLMKQIDAMSWLKLNKLFWVVDPQCLSADDVRAVTSYAADRFVDLVAVLALPMDEGISSSMEESVRSAAALFAGGIVCLTDSREDNAISPKCKRCYTPPVDGKITPPRVLAYRRYAEILANANCRVMLSSSAADYGASGVEAVLHRKPFTGIDSVSVPSDYKVIVANADFFDLSSFQADPTQHPAAGTGFLPLGQAYAFSPKGANVSGVCATFNGKFSDDMTAAEQLLYPRLLAIAEGAWSLPERKSFRNFEKRLSQISAQLSGRGYGVFVLDSVSEVRPESLSAVANLALDKTVHYHVMFEEQYPAADKSTLTDGQLGGWSFSDGRWQGFQGTNIDVTIDLGQPTDVCAVEATFIHDSKGRIFTPRNVEVYGSDDGAEFTLLGEMASVDRPSVGFELVTMGWSGESRVRYLRYKAHAKSLSSSWMFVDEIVVR